MDSMGSAELADKFADPGGVISGTREAVKPARDEKVITAWNGLMLAAFADAAGVLNSDEYLEIAKRNAAFIRIKIYRQTDACCGLGKTARQS